MEGRNIGGTTSASVEYGRRSPPLPLFESSFETAVEKMTTHSGCRCLALCQQ